MKNIHTLFLNEKRSHPETNKDLTFNQYLNKLLSTYNIDDIFVSFRKSVNVTDVNPNNGYETPTGVYTYPLLSFKDKIDPNIDEDEFRRLFPFQNNLEYIFFYVVQNKDGLIENSTPKNILDEYVKKIKSLYTYITPISNLCDLFLNGEYESPHITRKNDAHSFWLFLYSVVPYISNSNNKQTAINTLCNKIGVVGFADYNGDGYIHQAEPHQAVFFKIKSIAKIYYYSRKKKNIKSLIEYLKKISGKKITNIVSNFGEYGGDVACVGIGYDYKIFVNKKGESSIGGVDLNKINDLQIRAAYFNTKLNVNKFEYVYEFGKYGDNIAYSFLLDGTYTFINREGKVSIEGVNVNVLDNRMRAAYFNAKLNRNKFEYVCEFGEYGGDIARAQLRNYIHTFINREGNLSIEGVDVNKINDDKFRAAYFNIKLKTNKFYQVEEFGVYSDNIARAYLKDIIGVFINREGKPSIEGIDSNKINDHRIQIVYDDTLKMINQNKLNEQFNRMKKLIGF